GVLAWAVLAARRAALRPVRAAIPENPRSRGASRWVRESHCERRPTPTGPGERRARPPGTRHLAGKEGGACARREGWTLCPTGKAAGRLHSHHADNVELAWEWT